MIYTYKTALITLLFRALITLVIIRCTLVLHVRLTRRVGIIARGAIHPAGSDTAVCRSGRDRAAHTFEKPALVRDLEEDPFVSYAVSAAACELKNRYGMFLAPVAAVIMAAKRSEISNYPKYE